MTSKSELKRQNIMRGRPMMEGIETMTSPKDERITVETWAFLDMLAAEIRRVAGDEEGTVDLAERVQGIATVLKEQASK